jgi:hypothetical protein
MIGIKIALRKEGMMERVENSITCKIREERAWRLQPALIAKVAGSIILSLGVEKI